MDLKAELTDIIQCSNCVLDTSDDQNLKFDENGKCSHCYSYDLNKLEFIKEGTEANILIETTINKIKDFGKDKKYDCLIGLSGGVDSSYVAYLAKKFGLNALCVHFDNGWNTELAVMNIQNIVNKLGFDLTTYVIDWNEFRDLQLAYLHASVVDIEVLTDHAIYGSMFNIAKKHNIKYVLGGHNVVTEGVLPYHWTYNKKDYINIKDIHKKFGKSKIKTYPFLDRKLKRTIKKSGIEFINYLNWVPFVKDEIKEILKKELNWRDYGGKHHESIWTRFYQGIILPNKFNIDKRKAHLSSLICSGQISKTDALKELQKPHYDPMLLKSDFEFVLKKLGLKKQEFEQIMNLPVRSHFEFEIEGSFFNYYPFLKPLKPTWEYLKRFKKIKS
jgi:N-acetyl sugar amidotransferase